MQIFTVLIFFWKMQLKYQFGMNKREAKQKSLVAELYGLRAMVHFELHRNFGAPDAEVIRL